MFSTCGVLVSFDCFDWVLLCTKSRVEGLTCQGFDMTTEGFEPHHETLHMLVGAAVDANCLCLTLHFLPYSCSRGDAGHVDPDGKYGASSSLRGEHFTGSDRQMQQLIIFVQQQCAVLNEQLATQAAFHIDRFQQFPPPGNPFKKIVHPSSSRTHAFPPSSGPPQPKVALEVTTTNPRACGSD